MFKASTIGKPWQNKGNLQFSVDALTTEVGYMSCKCRAINQGGALVSLPRHGQADEVGSGGDGLARNAGQIYWQKNTNKK